MFTAIAGVYDLNNTLLSFGLHHHWKRLTASYVPAVTNGRALDIGAGTADLALLVEPKMGEQGHVVASDLNHAMLAEGLRKVTGREDCAIGLPASRRTPNNSDFLTRRSTRSRRGSACETWATSLRPLPKSGGCYVQVDALCVWSSPGPLTGGYAALYDWYSFRLLPWIGTKVARDRTGVYEYLPASIRTFPDQERLATLLREAGFRQVEYRNLTGGIVAIHVATK
jgi:demethylmenaquinone methyltransferase/2-methoxy-6-polyprenyl-1,4-benzoquinol methylase